MDVQAKRIIRKVQATRTKVQNEKRNIYIHENIMNYIKEDIKKGIKKGHTSLLDRSMPNLVDTLRLSANSKAHSAITITYCQAHRDNLDEQQLKRTLKQVITNIACQYEAPIEIVLIPDVDEAGNFHYHGTVNIQNKYRPAFKKIITKNIGFMKFKYIETPEDWFIYCLKLEPKYKRVYTDEEIQKLGIYLNI